MCCLFLNVIVKFALLVIAVYIIAIHHVVMAAGQSPLLG